MLFRSPDAVHQQAEWENAHSYASGWADGYAAGQLALVDEIARTIGVKPYSVKAVIQRLCRDLDLDQREPYSSPANGTMLTVQERDVIGRWAA